MRLVRRALIALSLGVSLLPFANSSALAGPIDSSTCGSWIRIVDVSSWNVNLDWSQIAHAGIYGAYIKATEGTWYTNPLLNAQRAGAASQGLPAGFYDFARPSDNPIADAKFFVSNGGAAGTLPPVLDLETNGSSEAQTAQWAVTWIDTVKTLTGRVPTIYTGAYYSWSNDPKLPATGSPLWVAAYPLGYQHVPNDAACSVANSQPKTGAWGAWSLWQFTSTGVIGGIPGNVDVSAIAPIWWHQMTGAGIVAPQKNVNKYPAGSYGIGSTGAAVVQIQKELNGILGTKLILDGQFGSNTEAGVLKAQRQYLKVSPADGIWGPATQRAYNNWFQANQHAAAARVASYLAYTAKMTKDCSHVILREGLSGNCVKFAQTRLKAKGWTTLVADGKYGPTTSTAVSQFQTGHHIPVGYIGRRTWKALTS